MINMAVNGARLLVAGVLVMFALGTEVAAQCKGTQVPLFGQCGGRSSSAGLNAPDPSLCCPADALCRPYNVFFWQCQPRGYTAPPEPPVTYSAACSSKTKVNRWDACGGFTTYGQNATDPSICCPSGFNCNHYDEYFWQCQPDGYVAPPKPIGTWDGACTGTKVKLWGQCGGTTSPAKQNASDPNSCCPLESSCNYYDDSFWQCQPPGWVPPKEIGVTTIVLTVEQTMPLAASSLNLNTYADQMASEACAEAGAGSRCSATGTLVSTTGRRRLLQKTTKIRITITIRVRLNGRTIDSFKASLTTRISSVAALARMLRAAITDGTNPDEIARLTITVVVDGTASPSPSPSTSSPSPNATSPSPSPSPNATSPSPSPSPPAYGSPSPESSSPSPATSPSPQPPTKRTLISTVTQTVPVPSSALDVNKYASQMATSACAVLGSDANCTAVGQVVSGRRLLANSTTIKTTITITTTDARSVTAIQSIIEVQITKTDVLVTIIKAGLTDPNIDANAIAAGTTTTVTTTESSSSPSPTPSPTPSSPIPSPSPSPGYGGARRRLSSISAALAEEDDNDLSFLSGNSW